MRGVRCTKNPGVNAHVKFKVACEFKMAASGLGKKYLMVT